MGFTLGELAKRLDADLSGDAELLLSGMAEIKQAKPDQLCFAESEAYLDELIENHAGGAIVPIDFPDIEHRNLLRVKDPRMAFIKAMELFTPDRQLTGIHPSAVIDTSAKLGKGVGVGPNVVIEGTVEIGEGSNIRAGCYIGKNVSIGNNCEIGPNASVLEDSVLGDRCILHPGACIGADGYGFKWLGDHHHKIPQLGNAILGNDVEIGANSCVDRATLGSTTVGNGTKLDNLVHIAHNDEIGKHVLMTSLVGIAGSSKIGDNVILAGQSGVADHVTIGDGVLVGAKSAVMKDVPAGEKIWGIPARPMGKAMKEQAALSKLAKKLGEFRKLQKDIEALKSHLDEE